jgi:hypothetical protein
VFLRTSNLSSSHPLTDKFYICKKQKHFDFCIFCFSPIRCRDYVGRPRNLSLIPGSGKRYYMTNNPSYMFYITPGFCVQSLYFHWQAPFSVKLDYKLKGERCINNSKCSLTFACLEPIFIVNRTTKILAYSTVYCSNLFLIISCFWNTMYRESVL